jgi:hypothetical protein
LSSAAFGDPNTPQGAIAGADARFSVQVTIPAGVAPGTYTITGRCGGGNLGVQATLVVAATLPATGGGGPVDASHGGSSVGSVVVALAVVLLVTASPLVARWRSGRAR